MFGLYSAFVSGIKKNKDSLIENCIILIKYAQPFNDVHPMTTYKSALLVGCFVGK